MMLKLKRTPGLYLIGFMGSGKTTVGRLLADRLGWPFADLDDDIEAREQSSIEEIFSIRGEAEFRRIETEAMRNWVRSVERGHPLVLALGGGAFVDRDNIDLLDNHGVTIWLDCPFDLVKARVMKEFHRPLARDLEKCERLYNDRRASYALANYRVDSTDVPPAHIVESILKLPLF